MGPARHDMTDLSRRGACAMNCVQIFCGDKILQLSVAFEILKPRNVSGNCAHAGMELGLTYGVNAFRSGTPANSSSAETVASIAEHFGLVRLRELDASALPDSRSRIPRAGFGIDILPAWRFGLRWDCAVENALV